MTNPTNLDLHALERPAVKRSGPDRRRRREAAEDSAFRKAQRQARKWADKGLALSEAGEIGKALQAGIQAEMWLESMLLLEGRIRSRRPLSSIDDEPTVEVAITERRIRPLTTGRPCVPYRSSPSHDQSIATRSLMLYAWRR